jgi:SAM-dependent methyltransferase
MPLRDDNLRRFVQNRATPYSPAAADYPAQAFPTAIRTNRHSAIYAMHSYHQGKKPHDAIRQYIRHFSRPGELVLDPFCGSGGTALATMLEGRTAIALDRSPAAVFIAQNYCTPVDPAEVQQATEELMAATRPELDWLYETRCDRCGGPARTAYTVYSEQFSCPHCQQIVLLADCPQVAAGPKKTTACPHCLARGHVEAIHTREPRPGTRLRVAVPALAVYRCLGGCLPAEDQRRHDDADAKKREYFARFDLGKIEEIARNEIPHWRPTTAFPTSFARWQTDLRLAGIQGVADLYTKRNLWALAAIRTATAANCCPQAALFALTAISLAVSRMQRYSPASGFPNMLLVGTYYIPPVGREIEVGSWYEGKLRALAKGYAAIRREMPAGSEGLIAAADARRLDVPSNSIDYIFTDPPYADAVQYGELNFVWESWLGGTPDWHADEIVVNRARGKDTHDWAGAMRAAMGECHRVLKPGRWLSLCYHDTSARRWAMLQDLMHDAGFVIDSAAAAGSIETGQKSFNQWMSSKATKRDLVISFRKPRPGQPRPSPSLPLVEGQGVASSPLPLVEGQGVASSPLPLGEGQGVASSPLPLGEGQGVASSPLPLGEGQGVRAVAFEAAARQILCDYLAAHGSAPKDRLYDALVSHLVCRGLMQAFDFEALLRSVAEEDGAATRPGVDRTWRLKAEQAIQTRKSPFSTWHP